MCGTVKAVLDRFKMMVKIMYRKILVFFSCFELWWKLIAEIFKSLIEIIRNPSFIMFSTIAIGLGTMGIWIGFFSGAGTASSANGDEISLAQKIDNLSVFTFCIATLGSVATDYFFEEKNYQNKQSADHAEMLSKHGMFFLWTLSALMSFAALKTDNAIYWALGLTTIFWLFINIKKPKFQKINEYALKNLDPNLKSETKSATEIKGKGL
ncbi:MAG: hypothetical protein SwBeaBPW_13870 [Shewanella algae]